MQPQPQPQRKLKETKGSATAETKEQLLARLPDAWERFWKAHEDSLGRAARNGAAYRIECVQDVERAAKSGNMGNYAEAYRIASAAVDGEGFIKGFVDAWRNRGAVYNVVKTYSREYFVDLLRVLKERTALLQAIPSDAP